VDIAKIKEILDKVPFTLIVAAYLGSVAYDYQQFNTDPGSPFVMKQSEVNAAKVSKAKLEGKLKEAVAFAKTLDAKRNELRGLAVELQSMKETISENLDVPSFMKMTITEAKKVGLNIQSLKPKGSQPKEFYSEELFQMTFKGVFVQLLAFLQRLSNVAELANVENFEMKSIGSKRGRYVELEGMVEIKAYKYLGSKADSIGKPDSTTLSPPAGGPARPKVSPTAAPAQPVVSNKIKGGV
jgi:Tfp pilus assembly protein PilO